MTAIAAVRCFEATGHLDLPAPEERQVLYEALRRVLREAVDLGGRDSERDLYNQPGDYVRLMDSKTVGQPCPVCGAPIEKISYLGGACYLCPQCQT